MPDANRQERGKRLLLLPWKVLQSTFRGLAEQRVAEAAAGMAYYAVFSLFPLLLFLAVVVGRILETEDAYNQIRDLVLQFFPTSQDVILNNLRDVINARGQVLVVGAIGLLWSATGFFAITIQNVNRAWPHADARNPLQDRLLAIAMVIALVVLLALSSLYTVIAKLLLTINLPFPGESLVYRPLLETIIPTLAPWLFAFGLYLVLYRWVPKVTVAWPGAIVSALIAVFAGRTVTALFAWYVGSRWSGYELVYGSVSWLVALLFWIYLIGWISLFGAHLCAAINEHIHPARLSEPSGVVALCS